jgi:hypothetical protein
MCPRKEGFALSQRFSGYDRKDRDAYQTPLWVTATIVPHLQALGVTTVWDPACGDGQIVAALRDHAFSAIGTDITTGHDFLNGCTAPIRADRVRCHRNEPALWFVWSCGPAIH